MGFDPNQAIRRWTGGEHLTDSQVAGYNDNFAAIYARRCMEAPDGGRALDRYHQTLKGFDVVQQISRVTFIHFALPQSYEQFLVSRGCPDTSPREIYRRELIYRYAGLAIQLRSVDAALYEQVGKILDAIRAGLFTYEDEKALYKIRDMMNRNDPFFVLVGIRLLNLISWEDGALHLPDEFAGSVEAIASYDGNLFAPFGLDFSKLLIWEVVNVLEDMKKNTPPSSSSAAPSVPPAPALPPAAVPAEGGQGASAESLEEITAAEPEDFEEWNGDGWDDYEADTGDWEGFEDGACYYGTGEMVISEAFAPI